MSTQENYKPIPRPKVGQALSENMLGSWVDGINSANKNTASAKPPLVRWAVTVKDASGNYPDRADDPFVFPFQWINSVANDSAPNDLDMPIQHSDTTDQANPDHWKSINLTKENADDQPDGFALMRLAHHEYPDAFGNEKRKNAALYVPEKAIVLIVSSGGSYFIVHRPMQMRHVEALEAGAAATGLGPYTVSPFKCKSLHPYWTGDHPSLFTAPADFDLKVNASATEELYVHNTTGSDISIGDRFVAADFGDGTWAPLLGGGGETHTTITVVTAVRVDEATLKLQYKTTDVDVVNPQTESGWIDFHTGSEQCP